MKPTQEFKDFPLSVAIWEQTNNEGRKYYSVSSYKSYKNADGEWKQTNSLIGNESLRMSALLRLAHEWIIQQ